MGSRVDYLVSVLLALPGGGRPSGEGGRGEGHLHRQKGRRSNKALASFIL